MPERDAGGDTALIDHRPAVGDRFRRDQPVGDRFHRDQAVGDRFHRDQPVGPLGAFQPPTPVAELTDPTSGGEYNPCLTADRLELYFTSENRPDGVQREDIYRSTRSSVTAPWGVPSLVVELSTLSRDGNTAVSRDGLRLALASNRSGGKGGWDIWLTSRPSRQAAWAIPVAASLNTNTDEIPDTISDDGLLLVFHGHRSDLSDMLVATRTSLGQPWSTPQPLTDLNGPVGVFDSHASLTASRLVVVLDSDRPGGMGLRDLYIAQRSSLSTGFGTPTALAELNTERNDAEPWLSDDLRYIMFARSPVGSTGLFDQPSRLYEAWR